MKISTRGRYGVRLLIDLAEHSSEDHVTLASVAERQNISVRYLEQVAIILRRAGFIHSVKGSAGGYSLARSAADIIIGDALRILEGDMFIVEPAQPGGSEGQLEKCIRRTVFEPLNKKIAEFIDTQTLSTLVGTIESEDSYTYFI
jgi:Rrf2 family protein